MAKISYLISKSTKRAGKSGFHFDGSGSGSWFQKWFNKDHDEVNSNPSDIKELISKLVSEFDGNSESNNETRVEFEGSAEEIKEIAAWSIGEIKANADSLKDLANFAKSYCGSLADLSVKIYNNFNDTDKIVKENSDLRMENAELKKEAAEKKSDK